MTEGDLQRRIDKAYMLFLAAGAHLKQAKTPAAKQEARQQVSSKWADVERLVSQRTATNTARSPASAPNDETALDPPTHQPKRAQHKP